MIPTEGSILDWGCGHGLTALLAAEERPGRSVVGVDIDVTKLRVADRAAAATPFADRLQFRQVTGGDLPTGSWDGIVIVDVLYLLAPDSQEALVRAAALALRPGGVLVVKDMDERPKVKAWLAAVQELASVRVARITASAEGLHRPPGPDAVARWLADTGLLVERHPCHRGRHVPHVLVVGRRGGPVGDAARSHQGPGGTFPS